MAGYQEYYDKIRTLVVGISKIKIKIKTNGWLLEGLQ